MRIRRMETEDGGGILAVQTECPEASQWAAGDYERLREAGCDGWIAEEIRGERREILGFLVTRRAADELEILNVAVSPAARRRGAGRALVDMAENEARGVGVGTIWLEVRESNDGARRFYEAAAFRIAGRRTNYYRNPSEDALTLRKKIAEKAG